MISKPIIMISDILRKTLSRYLTQQDKIIFTNRVPESDLISKDVHSVSTLGIYLHIPFCERICPYCPYNKEIHSLTSGENYVNAVLKEIDFYAPLLNNKPISSFYIGGGTPTTMLGRGIEKIIDHIYTRFNMQCPIHMESHPNHLTKENLCNIEAMGVKYLSVGVEALQNRHLKTIERPYTVSEVQKSIERAVNRNFECVNIDFIFDLPGQAGKEIDEAGHLMVDMGIQQVATYPLFRFPYTPLGKIAHKNKSAVAAMFRRRRLLKILEEIFYNAGFERSSVWAFTQKGTEKYCSVTVPAYLGLGASGGTYLKNLFYVNTFSVAEYTNSINKGITPIALSLNMSEEMQMAGWLYWRIYETKFNKSDFQFRFDKSFDEKFGGPFKILNKIGFLKNGYDQITLTDKGTYWIHAFEDFFSIDYINKLWGTSKFNPWPEKVEL